MTPEQSLQAGKIPLIVMLDNVRSLNNVGAILRTCDAFAIRKVIMCGITGTPPSLEIHKTALGAEDSVPWQYAPDTLEALKALKGEGWKICVLEQTHNSVQLQDFPVKSDEKYVVICGNEVQGVSQSVVDAADVILEIPQRGAKHSLNVSVSTAITLWHFFLALDS